MMRLSESWTSTRDIVRRFGLKRAVEATSCKVINHGLFVRQVIGMSHTPSTLSRHFGQLPPGLTFGQGSPDELATSSGDPALDLSARFVYEAIQHGNDWYVIRDAGRVVAYMWCAERMTTLYPGVAVAFSSAWSYSYKWFTVETHRGRRLIAHLNCLVLQEALVRGKDGLLCVVESTNYPSRRSCAAMGYVPFARAVMAKLGGRVRIWHREGYDVHGFRLVRV